jgi:hypothetical protein
MTDNVTRIGITPGGVNPYTGSTTNNNGNRCIGNKSNTTIHSFTTLTGKDLTSELKSQDLCAYNCSEGGDTGLTCFNNARNAIKPTQQTLTFILSDGKNPQNTSADYPENRLYIFSKTGVNFEGLGAGYALGIDSLNYENLKNITKAHMCAKGYWEAKYIYDNPETLPD